jgi:hypothetical protein
MMVETTTTPNLAHSRLTSSCVIIVRAVGRSQHELNLSPTERRLYHTNLYTCTVMFILATRGSCDALLSCVRRGSAVDVRAARGWGLRGVIKERTPPNIRWHTDLASPNVGWRSLFHFSLRGRWRSWWKYAAPHMPVSAEVPRSIRYPHPGTGSHHPYTEDKA